MTPSQLRRRRVAMAAAPFGGVLSRAMLGRLDVDSHVVQREVSADRWALHGRRTVAMTTAPLDAVALGWRAVWEVGCGAALDGTSSLSAGGMRGFRSDVQHVSVPHETRPVRVPGVRIHRVHRLPDEIVQAGVPRTRPAIAAVRGAHWASSNQQAALVLVLPVQQRMLTQAALHDASERASGRRRRAWVAQLVRDICDGAQSLGELDFAHACRRRGLPPPDRQVVVTTSQGRIYLDVRWSAVGLVVEIDGVGHTWGLAPTSDTLRQNAVTLGGDLVLRIDLVGWRLNQDAYLDQVCAAHRQLSHGWVA